MRIWSLHPRYLDRQGLSACWRESLLAQKVLAGRTSGYRRHPQLERFREAPSGAIQAYLSGVADEAETRGYRFDRGRIERVADAVLAASLTVTSGQLAYEWAHLMAKLRTRSPDRAAELALVEAPDPHPLFVVVDGPVAGWEVLPDDGGGHG